MFSNGIKLRADHHDFGYPAIKAYKCEDCQKVIMETGVDRRDVIRTRSLRFAPVGSIPTSPGRREPSAPERVCSVRERLHI